MKFKFKKYPYFIAEIGVNHENNINLAEKIIKQAADGGASAVKFQTYKAELLASKNCPAYWDTKQVKITSQYRLFKKFDKFNITHYKKLKKICDYYKIDFLSTPFDNESAQFLNKLVKYFKIASADISNRPLIDKIISFNKPIIFSTGASNTKEITDTYRYIRNKNKKIDIAILHCILSYPTNYNNCNLNIIKLFKKKYSKALIGLSDHTIPDKNMIILTKAYDLGAQIIEKHFTELRLKGKKNNDHFHSMNAEDLKIFYSNIELVNKSLGKEKKIRTVLPCEKAARRFARRSMHTLKKIKKNESLTEENTIPKRPGIGISPIFCKQIYGKIAKRDIPEDTLIRWNRISDKK
jgi:N-acetylneuraminate synthase